MFALAEQGHRSLFEQLVACPSPRALAALGRRRIDTLTGDTTFHAAKAHQIREIARVGERQGGELPCDESPSASTSAQGAFRSARPAPYSRCAGRWVSRRTADTA